MNVKMMVSAFVILTLCFVQEEASAKPITPDYSRLEQNSPVVSSVQVGVKDAQKSATNLNFHRLNKNRAVERIILPTFKKLYYEYYEKWFKLHRRACEAWHLLKKKDYERALFELDMYYGEDE